jgi:uncharacterized protein YbjT (DUF2867 family)
VSGAAGRPLRVLVTGATGYIGGRLIPLLLREGHQVRVLVRDPERIRDRSWSDAVEAVTGDLLDASSLAGLGDGVDAAYYLVHSMSSERDFAASDRHAARNFADAVKGIGKVVYVGGLLPDGASAHLRSRAEVGRILRDRLPTTEFRAGPIIGSGSASFEMVRYLTERLPVMVTPRWVENEVQPIAIADVLEYLRLALDRPPLGVVDIGANVLTFRRMMEGYADARGLRRHIVPLPILAPGLAARWVGLVTPIPNRLAVPLVEGLVSPVVGDTTRALQHFPAIQPRAYRWAVADALRKIDDAAVETRWSGALHTRAPRSMSDREGVIREIRTVTTLAPRAAVYRVLTSMGGDRGWLAWNRLWRLRGLADRLMGGPGLRRGRRHPSQLLVGEAVDFWRVERLEPDRLIRLRAEMRVPGAAWLQWELEPAGAGTRIVQSALFAPTGASGSLYWYLLYPIHAVIFNALIRAIQREAESAGEPVREPASPPTSAVNGLKP